MANLAEKIEQLPDELKLKAEGYVDALLADAGAVRPKGRKVGMSWAGALRDYRDQFTSQELKEKLRDWRIESLIE